MVKEVVDRKMTLTAAAAAYGVMPKNSSVLRRDFQFAHGNPPHGDAYVRGIASFGDDGNTPHRLGVEHGARAGATAGNVGIDGRIATASCALMDG